MEVKLWRTDMLSPRGLIEYIYDDGKTDTTHRHLPAFCCSVFFITEALGDKLIHSQATPQNNSYFAVLTKDSTIKAT